MKNVNIYHLIVIVLICFLNLYLDWKLAFCSSSFDFINKYPYIFLIYRTLLFILTIYDLIQGILFTDPIHEWPIYHTHLTLLITFFAVSFQFLVTCRVNFYRGNDIVPRHALQYIHIILIIISLGSGLVVSLVYWAAIYKPSAELYPKIIFDHGLLWFLLLIDIFLFTRLPIYMIDCIPLVIFLMLYGIFTIIIFICKSKFSKDRIGYIYRDFNFNNSPIRVTILMLLFIFFLPIGILFILWNLFRLRRSIHIKIQNETNSNINT